jgi:hypothetical protein
MHTGVIPSSLKAFLEAVSKEIPSAALPVAPPRRKPRQKAVSPAVPRRSSRLAMKAGRRILTTAATKNVLMRNLGLAGNEQVESAHLSHYINLFRDVRAS